MSLGWKNHCLITFVLVFISLASHAQYTHNPIKVVELHKEDNISLLRHSQILEDAKGKLTWQQAMTADAWVSVETPELNLGMTNSTFWFRVDIKYAEVQTRFFEIRYPLLDYVDFFLLQDNRLVKHVETGDSRPFNSRDLKNKNFVTSHYQDTDQVLTLLIKAKTQGSMVLPLSTVSVERYAQEISLESLTHGIYFGISIAMFLYNLMLFVYLKDRSYLYYCLFVFIVFISALAYTGQGFYRIWPEYEGLNRYMTPVTSAAGFLAATLFFGNFLQLNDRGVWGRRVFLICACISVFSVAAALFVSYSKSVQMLTLIQLLLTVLYLGTSTYLWKKGVLEAKYFTFAWVFFITGNSINAARVLGILPSNMFTIYANLYGNAIEMLMLSMGLAYRIETMKDVQLGLSKQLRKAQQSAIKNLEKYRDLFQKSPVGLFRYERNRDEFFNNEKSNSLINEHENFRKFLQDKLTFSDYKILLKSNRLKNKTIKYGSEKYYNLSLFVIRDEGDEVVEIEGSLLDISEQQQTENLRLAGEQEKLSSLTQLVFGISHHFNTPLGVMIVTDDLIKEYLSKILDDIDNGQLKKDQLLETLIMMKEAIVLASENTKIMSSMLKDLRYSINTRENLNLSEIKTESLFKDLLGYFKVQMKENNAECLLDINVSTNGIETICSDYDVLSDVFLRLYVNTFYHAYTKHDKNGTITINLSEDDQYICIEYSDDGRGLSAAEQENIFIPFYTGNSRKKGNSGLGMYILHNQVVKILQGKAELQSSTTGFSIKIYLPKKYPERVVSNKE
jgi:signal transduction histidine kinase